MLTWLLYTYSNVSNTTRLCDLLTFTYFFKNINEMLVGIGHNSMYKKVLIPSWQVFRKINP